MVNDSNTNFLSSLWNKVKTTDTKQAERINKNKLTSNDYDGAVEVGDAVNGFLLTMDHNYSSQADQIEAYRDIASYNIVDYAVEDIVNEMVSFDEEENPIELNLSDIESKDLSDKVKDVVYEKWDKISKLLDLNSTIHRRVKQFYIDGRLAYQKVIDSDSNGKDGLLSVIELDTRYVTKYVHRTYNKETKTVDSEKYSFLYNENINSKTNLENKNIQIDQISGKQYQEAKILDPKALTFVTSGMIDQKTKMTIGWLNKAIRPANNLRMMENALIIYRITRAPERRLFYVDVSNMPKTRAENYMRNLKNTYRNRMSYDPEKGNFKDQRYLQTMQEDYWLPRNTQGRGTEVSTLPGGDNLGQIDDVEYFKKELYKALNIPISRLESDSSIQLGRATEIGRDELKFSKFVSSVRKRFNMMFLDLLKTELILSKIITVEEWDIIKNNIRFVYAQDLYLEEQKNSEMLRDRLDLLTQIDPYIGKYYSHAWTRKNILRQTDKDIEEEDELIEKEESDSRYSDSDSNDTFAGPSDGDIPASGNNIENFNPEKD